jgi:hypothetical protein
MPQNIQASACVPLQPGDYANDAIGGFGGLGL